MLSSNTLTSMKIAKSLGNLFMFRESEKSLKRTPGVSFSYNRYESKKVIKVYSVTFSLIYKHEKEQILSSRLFSFLHKLDPDKTMLATSQCIIQGWLVVFPQLKKLAT